MFSHLNSKYCMKNKITSAIADRIPPFKVITNYHSITLLLVYVKNIVMLRACTVQNYSYFIKYLIYFLFKSQSITSFLNVILNSFENPALYEQK